jgi:hypothetical protein
MSHEKEYEKCSICIGLMTEKDEDFILTLKCNHSYHTKCIAQWIIDQGTCPLCRKNNHNVRSHRNPLITFNVSGYDEIFATYKSPIESFAAHFACINTLMTILLGLFMAYVPTLIAFLIKYFYFSVLHHNTNTTYNWDELTSAGNLIALVALIFSMNIFTYIIFLVTLSDKIIDICIELLVPIQFLYALQQQICRIERLFIVNVMLTVLTLFMIIWGDECSGIIYVFAILNSVMIVNVIDLIIFSWARRLTFYPNTVYERIFS